MASFRWLRLFAVVGLCALLCGCGSKINKGNYDKVKTGMSEQEVQAILGPGEEQASTAVSTPGVSAGGISVPGMSMSGSNKVWKDGAKAITITFINGKVTAKAEIGL